MPPEKIVGKSQRQLKVSTFQDRNGTLSADGIKCDWRVAPNHNNWSFNFSFTFNWRSLVDFVVDGLSGQITVTFLNGDQSLPDDRREIYALKTIDVYLTETPQEVEMSISPKNYGYSSEHYFILEFSLTPSYPVEEPISYDNLFLASEHHDAILVVQGRKLHVNKSFLSYQSDFFNALFSSNFKEGQLKEIPLKDISFEDFALLCSSFYPNPVFPNDKTVPKLLEMADRFQVLSVIRIVEYHLIHNSKIGNEKMLWMADRYAMPKLMEKVMRQTNTIEKAKALNTSQEYQRLSDAAKSKVLDRLMKLI